MRLALPVSILLLFLFLFLLGQSYFEVKGRVQRLELLRAEVGTFQDRKAELEEELAYRQDLTYVEGQAREQLGYAFPNEEIVVLPDFEKEREEKGGALAASSSGETSLAKKEIPIWKRWGCLLVPGSWTCL